MTQPVKPFDETYGVPPEFWPDLTDIQIDDGKPVDNMYSERQMRLLVDSLYGSYKPPTGKPFLAVANVGMFHIWKKPPVVPDVLLSLDVIPGGDDPHKKENLAYFFWIVGKPPEAVTEIVSNKEGGELGDKKDMYERLLIPYYIVWDQQALLGEERLHCFALDQNHRYRKTAPWFPMIELGVTLWEGHFQDLTSEWLRWSQKDGGILLTGQELAEKHRLKAEQERQKAEQERQKAEQQRQRADALAAKLRAAGIDPDQP